MPNHTSTCLIIGLFTVLAKATTFADCLNRQLLLNEEGSLVVEDAVATIMGSLAQFSIADLVEEQSVTSYVNQIVESDCSSVQTSIDLATSTDALPDYLNVALMENIHAFDSAQTSTAVFIGMYVHHQNQDHGHGYVICDVINGFPADVRDKVIADMGYTFCNGRRALDSSIESFPAQEQQREAEERARRGEVGSPTDFVCRMISSFPIELRLYVIINMRFFHCLTGRRALSENVISITPSDVISITPSDVLMGCTLGAPSEICSLGLSGLAEDFMMTLCGGDSDILACEVSSASMHAAIAQLEGRRMLESQKLGLESEQPAARERLLKL